LRTELTEATFLLTTSGLLAGSFGITAGIIRFSKIFKIKALQEDKKYVIFFFFSVRERVVSSESCILIGSGSGQNFPISDHGHGNRAKTIE